MSIKFNELARQTDLPILEKFNINGRWAINTYETDSGFCGTDDGWPCWSAEYIGLGPKKNRSTLGVVLGTEYSKTFDLTFKTSFTHKYKYKCTLSSAGSTPMCTRVQLTPPKT